MEKIIDNLSSAMKNIKTADYMLTMTYETLKEPKLLMSVTKSIYDAVEKSISAALYYERYFKKIPPFNESNFAVKIDIFKKKLASKYNIGLSEFEFIYIIKRILQEHKQSVVEFTRKDNFFIYDDNYKQESLNKDDVKQYITKAKVFIDKIFAIISKKR